MIANPNDGNSPQVEVATPTISVSAGGLITATTQQGKGYVPGGSKSAIQQLTTQGAKTVTPTTTEQIAVASGLYTTGDVKVAGDANLVAKNIAEGVSIFGVTGTHSGGGGAAFQHGSTVSSAGGKYSQYSFSISLNGGENIIVYTYLDAPYVIGYVYNQSSVAIFNGDYTMSITYGDNSVTISGACGSEFGITIDYYYIIF